MADYIDPEEFFRSQDATARDPLPNGQKANGAGSHRKFTPVRFRDIKLSTTSPCIIRGLFPNEGLCVVWGPPKCGKSFWVYDALLHVSLGWEYRGRKVRQGPVVYVACEGERGLGARSEAIRLAKFSDDADPPFWLLTTRLDLAADADELIHDIKAAIGPHQSVTIAIDTLNRSIAGSESRDEDMGAYVKAADKLREAFGGLVVLIHHCGINGERPRGHTSLTGACDAQIAVKRDAADRIIATVEFMKDGAEGDVIASRLAVVDVGLDEDGDPITSCVVEPAEADAAAIKQNKRLPDAARIALDTLRKAVDEAGQDAPASNHIPQTVRVVDIETWRRYHYVGTASDGQTPEARRKAFQRVRQQLQASGTIGLHADLCWVASHA
jgi:hypothetical protein